MAWAARQAAGYRRPRQVVVVNEIPRGNHGKIHRAATTELVSSWLHDEQATDTA